MRMLRFKAHSLKREYEPVNTETENTFDIINKLELIINITDWKHVLLFRLYVGVDQFFTYCLWC